MCERQRLCVCLNYSFANNGLRGEPEQATHPRVRNSKFYIHMAYFVPYPLSGTFSPNHIVAGEAVMLPCDCVPGLLVIGQVMGIWARLGQWVYSLESLGFIWGSQGNRLREKHNGAAGVEEREIEAANRAGIPGSVWFPCLPFSSYRHSLIHTVTIPFV